MLSSFYSNSPQSKSLCQSNLARIPFTYSTFFFFPSNNHTQAPNRFPSPYSLGQHGPQGKEKVQETAAPIARTC